MHTIIHRLHHNRFPHAESAIPDFRSPYYDCIDLAKALKLVVYVPGVNASGIEITTQGPDLFVTARKTHHVRANWPALHLERAQRDYQLKLRLGLGLDYDALQASVARGVLTIVLPKKQVVPASTPVLHREVA
jgi:HSP20 family protein